MSVIQVEFDKKWVIRGYKLDRTNPANRKFQLELVWGSQIISISQPKSLKGDLTVWALEPVVSSESKPETVTRTLQIVYSDEPFTLAPMPVIPEVPEEILADMPAIAPVGTWEEPERTGHLFEILDIPMLVM